MKYLVVRRSDGLIVNAVVWDGVSEFSIENCDLILLPDEPRGVWIGWSYKNGKFIEGRDNASEENS